MTTPRELLAQYATQSQLSSFFLDNLKTVSVKSYGATGDGVTDDTADIQSALDATGAGWVILPPTASSYKITSGLTIPSNVWLVGFGKLSKLDASGVAVGASIISITDKTNAGVTGVYIFGNNTSSALGGGIVITGSAGGSQDIAVRDCIIEKANFGVRIGGGSSRIVVAGNTILESAGTTDSGYGVTVAGNAQYVSVIDNTIASVGRHGIYIADQNSNHVIARNKIISPGWIGIAVYIDSDTTGDSKGHVITGNNIISAGQEGIDITDGSGSNVYDVRELVISDNIIDTPGSIGIDFNGGMYCQITGNIIKGGAADGINVRNTSGTAGDSCSNIIANNIVENNTGDGIEINGAANFNQMVGNSCVGNGAYGIKLSTSATSDNYLSLNLMSSNVSGTISDAGTRTLRGNGFLVGSTTWDPGNLADGGVDVISFTVAGAAVGDVVYASHDKLAANNVILSAHVQTADTVRVVLRNVTGGALDVASGTVKAQVWKT